MVVRTVKPVPRLILDFKEVLAWRVAASTESASEIESTGQPNHPVFEGLERCNRCFELQNVLR